MQFKLLKMDMKRNKVVVGTLFAFIMLAALLISGASSIIMSLSGSTAKLLEATSSSHYSQLHSGELDVEVVTAFAKKHKDLIKETQIVNLLNINGSNLYLGKDAVSEADSVMDNSFVKQNKHFDFILDTKNQPVKLKNGEVTVPLYHMQKYDLKIGDTISVKSANYNQDFVIKAFTRDSIMNPSIINSKRFLITDYDWEAMHQKIGEIEYMIEFQVHDLEQVSELEKLYQMDAQMPKKGSLMTHSLVQDINSISDGITAAVIILIALLFMLIALLCLRFTLISTIEEDYREIGVMKALGIPDKGIRKLYMTKYFIVVLSACIVGYVLSLLTKDIFIANITLYMGGTDQTLLTALVPLLGVLLIGLIVMLSCRIVLRRFKKITAVEGLNASLSGSDRFGSKQLTLSRSFLPNVNIFLGLKDVLGRIWVYGLLGFVFIICTFIMIVPINLLNTLNSPAFLSNMGAGNSQLRIDLQHSTDIQERYDEVMNYLAKDPEVAKYTPLSSVGYEVENADGDYETMNIEVGDFSVFPLDFASGHAPKTKNEIALSSLNAEELNKAIGDTVNVLLKDGRKVPLKVCGIYPDVTKGGKTAKAILPFEVKDIAWLTINLDVKSNVALDKKISEYSEAFYPARITDLNEYLYQTLGSIIDQLKMVTVAATILSLGVASLITILFFKMLITKELRQITIMRSLGFTLKQIRIQYMTRALLILSISVVIGMLLSNLLGGSLAGFIIPGISNMTLAVNPFISYLLCPLGLVAVVTGSIIISTQTIKTASDLKAIAE